MSGEFGELYAGSYDAIYDSKDYAGEVELLEKVFTEFGPNEVRRILDLGCGTGGHSLLLANRGYEVVGVDRSDAMLAVAQEKSLGSGLLNVRFVRGDVRRLDLGEQFDAAILMFAVLSYQESTSDVLETLRSARRHLDDDGLLFFDVWFGPAVLKLGPSDRARAVSDGTYEMLRYASGEVDPLNQVCRVRLRLWKWRGSARPEYTDEVHRMRFFFPTEIDLMLQQSGFELLKLAAFPDWDSPPDDSTWNVSIVARADADSALVETG